MSNDKTQTMIADTFRQLPAYFVPNVGQQEDKQIYYELKGASHGAFFTSEGVTLTFFKNAFQTSEDLPVPELGIPDNQGMDKEVRGIRLDFRFQDANPGVKPEGRLQGTGKVNYMKGNDPAKWHINIPVFQEVVYPDLWPGIDLIFQGEKGQIKYEFLVQPGAKVEDIRFNYDGAEGLSLDKDGNLLIDTPFGAVTDKKPVSFQEKDGQRASVSSSFLVEVGDNGEYVIGFSIGNNYDISFPLIIDPGLIYSTYLGGTDGGGGFDDGNGIAVDAAGNAYVIGVTNSSNFPTTAGAFDTTHSGGNDAFVTKLNPTGSALVYSTYLGGIGGDFGNGIAVDAAGNAYVTGFTNSPNFPTTAGAFDTTFNGVNDTFVTKLNPTGSALVYSTYLGGIGGESGDSIAVDAAGNAYVTGITQSPNFPTTAGAFDTTFNGVSDAFVTKLNPTGSALVYSTYLGGTGDDDGNGIAVDATGNAYVTGFTNSPNFPTTAGAFDTTFNGGFDAFVTKLNPTGSALVYSTYLGGTGDDFGAGIAVDAAGNAYVTGLTVSSNFPTTAGAFDTTFNGSDAFVTKLNPTGSALDYSTYLGGTGSDDGNGIAVDAAGNAYVTGETFSSNFPTTADAFDTTLNGVSAAFVTKLNPTGSALVYSTYLGGILRNSGNGIAVDAAGNAYVTGFTQSPDFPTTAGAFDTRFNSFRDAFVVKINTVSPPKVIEVVLGDFLIQTLVEGDIELPSYANDVKHIKKNVYLTQCKALPIPGVNNVVKLFVEGYIHKNIQYIEDCDGCVKDYSVDVPFSCFKRVELARPVVFPFGEFSMKDNVLQRRELAKDGMGADRCTFGSLTFEINNEPITCKLLASAVHQWDILQNFDKWGRFDKVTEKADVNLAIKLTQKQAVSRM